ncbi:ATP-binding protein [Salimicrobium halophilum]|uniref:histidine kinase n=1 Tax=Salimicrobium halophilum TaxID=86666 RepID=A0A1G8PYJ3_9BACI|nr:ATP-binding protein [Salimicrobium halophilum]SDI97503.1 two-component system, OmpR family, sensor histidine kinase ResE [Salimicrobium halophilum]
MFWRSVVVKLWFTILLLVCFVLMILTVLLLEFFENFHVNKAEEEMLQTASVISTLITSHQDEEIVRSTAESVKAPSSHVLITDGESGAWTLESNVEGFAQLDSQWFRSDPDLSKVEDERVEVKKVASTEGRNFLAVGAPLEREEGAVFVYKPLNSVEETTQQTTKTVFLGAGIAIVLTTIFAFFLSTRITAPLMKMRKGALELSKGEFHTKIPILTHDEIGELAIAFNRMGRQLKQNIDALNQEKEQLSGVLKSMADGVITLNHKKNILVTNPPAEQLLEWWRYEEELSKAELPSPLQDLFESVITEEREAMTEVTVQGRTWVIIMTPLYSNTTIRGVVAVFRDMTEERRLDKLRKDFLANVSHELRTPISMMRGYSEAIVDGVAASQEEKNELAQIILEESERMGRLVNELLDLARMESGNIQLYEEPVEVDLFVDRIVKKFHGVAEENHVHLRCDYPEGAVGVSRIDPDRIEQVITNLLDNAIRHTKEEGAVSVEVYRENNNWITTIEDTGSGIPEEDLPFIFERFYKGDKSRKRDPSNEKQGTGLGLAIAKNIVEAHGGTISAQSKLGEGTTFRIILPT